jgi:hypothetical protein
MTETKSMIPFPTFGGTLICSAMAWPSGRGEERPLSVVLVNVSGLGDALGGGPRLYTRDSGVAQVVVDDLHHQLATARTDLAIANGKIDIAARFAANARSDLEVMTRRLHQAQTVLAGLAVILVVLALVAVLLVVML